MTIKTIKLAAMAIAIAFLSSCNDDDDNNDSNPAPEAKGNMFIKFQHVWGPAQEDFALNTALVHPGTGEELQFTKLRYYISNVQLQSAKGDTWIEEESYHIVNAENSVAGEVQLNLSDVPSGSYTSISYMIGVDSLINVSGVQEGALDPAENMFWSWNTGYIFIKAEGQSDASANGAFTYHLGGFEGPYKANSSMFHDFQGATLEISPNDNPSVHLIVNPARFWHGGYSTEQTPMVHMPGEMASILASNFAGSFIFDHIHN